MRQQRVEEWLGEDVLLQSATLFAQLAHFAQEHAYLGGERPAELVQVLRGREPECVE